MPSAVLQPERSNAARPRGVTIRDHVLGIGTIGQRLHPSATWYVQRVDEELTDEVRAAMPFAATLGLEMLAASTRRGARPRRVGGAADDGGGLLHGGVLMGLADAVGAYCAFLNLPEGSAATATIESKTNFFAAVRAGRSRRARGRCTAAADDRRRDRPLRRGRQARRPRHADAGRALEAPAAALLSRADVAGDDERRGPVTSQRRSPPRRAAP